MAMTAMQSKKEEWGVRDTKKKEKRKKEKCLTNMK